VRSRRSFVTIVVDRVRALHILKTAMLNNEWPPRSSGDGQRGRSQGYFCFRSAFAAILAGVLALSSWQVQAAPLSRDGQLHDARPWAADVSEAEQATARELLAAGNHEFMESRFAQALAIYREAIKHWDHPAIRYNMAVCLINLDQLVEARDNLERSLAYGAAALDGDNYSQGLGYRKLLDAQLAHIKITCQEPGAEVRLDGKLLFTGPGTAEQFVMAGEHQVVAIKQGFVPVSKTLFLAAGKRSTHDVSSLEVKATTRVERRWSRWKPWAVLAGGAVLGGVGALSYLAAQRDYEAYNRGIASRCGGVNGCDRDTLAGFTDLHRIEDRADREQIAAFTLFAVGGGAAVAGAVGALINQPRIQVEASRRLPAVTASSTGATVSIHWRF
jgi:hypothetical protein